MKPKQDARLREPGHAWAAVCIGVGPGPKNVLAERDDGYRVVVPYAVWKHKLAASPTPNLANQRSQEGYMASGRRPARRGGSRGGRRGGGDKKQYMGITGFICFPPDDDEVDGDEVRRMKVQDGKRLYSVTVWPSHENVELDEGMFVGIQGAYTETEGDDTTYYNISANKLVVIGEDEGERSSKPSRGKGGGKPKSSSRGRARDDDEDDDEDDEDDDF